MSTAEMNSGNPTSQIPPLLSRFPQGQALPYTQVRKDVEFRGEVLVSDTWKPEFGVIDAQSVLFRIVFLSKNQEVPPQSIANHRVAVCIPATQTHQVREPQVLYLEKPTQPLSVASQAAQEEAAPYATGQVITREPLAISPGSVFSSPRPADWIESIAASLFPATWEASLPYAGLLAPEIKSAPPDAQASLFTAKLRDWEARLNQLATALSEVAATLSPPTDDRFGEAVNRLSTVCSASDSEQFYLLAEATYRIPPAMASDLALIERFEALALYLPEVVFARNYLVGVTVGDQDRELAIDRQSLLEQITTDALLSNPRLWPSLKTLFDWFKDRYRSAYMAHFRLWQQEIKQLQQLLQDKEGEVRALHYLNSIAELGEPVGKEILETYPGLRDRLKPCPLDENGLETQLNSAPVCSYCGLKLTDEAPAGEVNDFIHRLELALAQQQRRLSSQAIRLILSQSREPSIQQFLQIIQASDLSSLPLVLDDQLVAFIRQLLKEAKR